MIKPNIITLNFIFLIVKEFLPEKPLSQNSSSIVADLVCAKNRRKCDFDTRKRKYKLE